MDLCCDWWSSPFDKNEFDTPALHQNQEWPGDVKSIFTIPQYGCPIWVGCNWKTVQMKLLHNLLWHWQKQSIFIDSILQILIFKITLLKVNCVFQVYIEDSLGERIWVDSSHCKTFVDNIQTAFSTKMPPKSMLLQTDTSRSGGDLSAGKHIYNQKFWKCLR